MLLNANTKYLRDEKERFSRFSNNPDHPFCRAEKREF